ncbi:MAG: methionine adenosyltransferase [Oligosphaeraceae bacterium]|nr:methionine adenosyltransferase [Oligosphaeraceae bacterium]
MLRSEQSFIFTSESVSEGHPDKVCDQVADAILDACLALDPASRVACEVLATTDYILLAGEISCRAQVDYEAVARQVVRDIGYNNDGLGFAADTMKVELRIKEQSADIAMGVNADTSRSGEQGAGDQGMMFGFACSDTECLMPAPLYYAHRIMQRLAQLRHGQPEKYAFLRPDAKAQVALHYEGGKPRRLHSLLVSHQHSPEMDAEQLRKLVDQVLREIMPAELLQGVNAKDYLINPTGRFVIGGPQGDTGLTGRKIIVDSYGGMGRHGGGAFSGKDPSKVDRSASYMARYAAKNIVAAGLARACEIQVAYAIGLAKPVSINVNTFGSGKHEDERLSELMLEGEIFDFRPAHIIATLGLMQPKGWSYRETANYGHFGREQFPWEKTDKVEALLACL